MNPAQLRTRALALLARREHSRSELRRKLLRSMPPAQGDEPPVDIDALLDELAAKGCLSEERFVESRLHVRAARFGSQRIRQELAQHGLKLSPAQQQALSVTELERAREVWRRKFGALPPADAAQRARQGRFLAARGFAPDVVARVLRGADED